MRNLAKLVALLLAATIALPALAQTSETTADREEVERQLEEMRAMRKDMQRQMGSLQQQVGSLQQQMGKFDSQIDALETKLHGGAPAPAGQAALADQAPASPSAPGAAEPQPSGDLAAVDASAKTGFAGFMERKERIGTYDEQKGFVLASSEVGELNFSMNTYARYLNQKGLNDTYTDSFGRVIPIDIRNEIQLYKANLTFKGWLFDPNFRYMLFMWTNNANQGESGSIALVGFLQYRFADWLTVSAGILPVPTTRSTNYNYPKWLRHDNRVMADEFYRGSYTSGIDAYGTIAHGLQYRVMLGNNLSTLGVSSKELDDKLDTFAASLTWMPTTGEFGLANGFGDYDYHDEVATLLAGYVGHSTETAQGQPSESDFENSQIRLTDGTLLFSPDPFTTGGKIEEARWRMASVDAGIKYKGFSLEAQYYWRKVDKFKTIGFVPISQLKDSGVAVQASAMPIKDLLQAYVTYSKIWGANGNPDEWALGLNVYPFKRREVHVNFEALKLDRSPVGGYSLPMPVGGEGWMYLVDWVFAF